MNRLPFLVAPGGWRALVVALVLLCAPAATGRVVMPIDLLPCAALPLNTEGDVVLGIVRADGDETLVRHALGVTAGGVRKSDGPAVQLRICAEDWKDVLPRWAPWGRAPERGYGWIFFVLALVASAHLFERFVPRVWWARAPVGLGTAFFAAAWVLGVLGLAVFHQLQGHRHLYATLVSLSQTGEGARWHELEGGVRGFDRLLRDHRLLPGSPPDPEADAPLQANLAPAHELAAEAQPAPAPEGVYRVHRALNLRTAPATSAHRARVLEAGLEVIFDGRQDGDWWFVRVRLDKKTQGWVSSLWLRRVDE